ncbi:UbiA family prenyltransferase [Nocardia fluminea]|uniref:UbiA family prenyltransferase n=1 Tax=Nocardia fluminea TaxID=134984 RepID=UPI00364E8EC2
MTTIESSRIVITSWVVRAPLRELYLCWSFTWGDLTATVLPATLFAAAAWAHTGHTASSMAAIVPQCVVYFWLYIYTFNLSNQLVGVDEDRINKPHRPLVRELLSTNGAWTRLVLATIGFLLVGLALGVAEWASLWVAAWVFHNHLGGARTWWGKNAAMVVGTVAQLCAAWQIVTPLDEQAWRWILAIAVPLGILVSLQDLRDTAGDIAGRRRTAVVVFGEQRLRTVLCVMFAVYPVPLYWLLYSRAPALASVVAAGAATITLLISWRVVRYRNSKADNTTYMLYTCWYCLALASAVPALAN